MYGKSLYSRRFLSIKMTAQATNINYLKQEEAIKLDAELFSEYGFSVDQLMELAGLSVASVIYKEYKLSQYSKPVICCGPGNNGGDGLVCARHLKLFGYTPTVICPKPGRNQLYQNLLLQCRKFQIDIMDQVPTKPLEEIGDIIVDSIFGFSYKPPNRSLDFAKLLNKMHQSSKKMPLVSVDIPSGWHVENGPSDIEANQVNMEDDMKLPALEPDCLISLTAPKLSAKHFKGRFHYLGGRFCPQEIQEKYKLNLPSFIGSESILKLS